MQDVGPSSRRWQGALPLAFEGTAFAVPITIGATALLGMALMHLATARSGRPMVHAARVMDAGMMIGFLEPAASQADEAQARPRDGWAATLAGIAATLIGSTVLVASMAPALAAARPGSAAAPHQPAGGTQPGRQFREAAPGGHHTERVMPPSIRMFWPVM